MPARSCIAWTRRTLGTGSQAFSRLPTSACLTRCCCTSAFSVGPFAGHRDSVSELVGDVLESAIEAVLTRAGVSFRKTKRAERIPGFDQAPDFVDPERVQPTGRHRGEDHRGRWHGARQSDPRAAPGALSMKGLAKMARPDSRSSRASPAAASRCAEKT